ncbi:hypothetical protein U0070_013848 [Myodes glareolus]|uniref:Putative adherens-junction anchoring domain-containing protein n=1 Tax=Myodes glareolus TaxID=447135 RepID=A0AAW0H1B6_MYOGA
MAHSLLGDPLQVLQESRGTVSLAKWGLGQVGGSGVEEPRVTDCSLLPAAGTVSVGTSSCLSLSQHPSPTSVFRHHYIPYFRGSESGRSTPSLSVLSDSRPPSSTYQQAPRHFHIPDTGVKDNIYRKPPIYKQHATRRLEVEDSSFDQDSRKKTTWLLLKGDADTRTNSPDLDSQSLSLSSGAEREPLPRMPGDSLYSREWLL